MVRRRTAVSVYRDREKSPRQGFVEWVLNSGRKGGLALLGIGLVMVALNLISIIQTDYYYPVVVALGLSAVCVGILIIIFGGGASSVQSDPHRRTAGQLRDEVADRDFPFTICTRHRRLVPENYLSCAKDDGTRDICTSCNSRDDHMVITDREKLSFILAGLDMLDT